MRGSLRRHGPNLLHNWIPSNVDQRFFVDRILLDLVENVRMSELSWICRVYEQSLTGCFTVTTDERLCASSKRSGNPAIPFLSVRTERFPERGSVCRCDLPIVDEVSDWRMEFPFEMPRRVGKCTISIFVVCDVVVKSNKYQTSF